MKDRLDGGGWRESKKYRIEVGKGQLRVRQQCPVIVAGRIHFVGLVDSFP